MRRNYTRWFNIVPATVFAFSGNSFGHGTRGSITPGSGMLIHAEYDDGEPMAYSRTEIFHAGKERPFQSGATDRNGRFLFYPDSTGQWKVAVDDGMGHAVIETIQFEGRVADAVRETKVMPKRYGVITGLAAIFGAFGWAAFLRLKFAGKTKG